MKLIYFSPSFQGGLADYAHEQANALAGAGVDVRMLAAPEFFSDRNDMRYSKIPLLDAGRASRRNSVARKFERLESMFRNYHMLARTIEAQRIRHVLFGSYAEYFSPIWAWQFSRLARNGVVFGSVVHDPVRDFVLGPAWWHRYSVACGYSFVREAFVHEAIALDTVRPMPRLRTSEIPHGPYSFPPAIESRVQFRQMLQIPEKATVLLSFGHIRDGKNLGLALQALAEFPDAYLLVAGKEQSGAQKAANYYQKLAVEAGVADRCRWLVRHIPAKEVGGLFSCSDVILLTYSRAFRSASGVLNVAVNFRKPCLASSGGGNLRTVIERYDLGYFVEPDNLPALKQGLRHMLQSPPSPRWKDYEIENSWEENARIVRERMFEEINRNEVCQKP